MIYRNKLQSDHLSVFDSLAAKLNVDSRFLDLQFSER